MAKSLDGVLIKKAHKKHRYSKKQLEEFKLCADSEHGPLYFLDNFFNIQHPTQGKIQYHPFEYQTRLLDTYHTNRYSISMMPRQTGKSTTAAGYLLWFAMFVPDSTILIAAHKYAGAQEIMQRIRYAYELCPNFIRAGVTSYNKGSIEFDNGSRIVAQTTTENTGRGMSISLLYCDEFAFVRPTIAKEFWTSISPTLATGGKAIITSTPNSDEDQFAIIWKGANKCQDANGNTTKLGENGFKAYRSYWKEHPERDDKWAEEERAKLGEERFKREMDCEFIIYDETLIRSATLMDLQGQEPYSTEGQIRWYQPIKKDQIYVVGLDPSLGTGGDPSAIQVYCANDTSQVAEWRHNKTTIPQQVKILADIVNTISEKSGNSNNVYFSLENNTIGEAALISMEDYGEQNYNGVMISEHRKVGQARRYRKGFNTTHKNKLLACAKLKTLIESNRLKVYSKPLVSELKTFVASGNSYSAKLGETDDLVMSTILCLRMLTHIQDYHKEISEQMTDHTDQQVDPMPFIMV